MLKILARLKETWNQKTAVRKRTKQIFLLLSNRRQKPEAYSELCQTSKIDCFAKWVNGFAVDYFCKTLYLRFYLDDVYIREMALQNYSSLIF